MSQSTFNLIDRPWIIVRGKTGETREVSLSDLLRDAPDIQQIVGEVPTQSFAILRLTLAVLYRALGGPRDLDEWRDAAGDWDATAEKAIAYLERHHDRFDMRHPETPFYQVAGLHTSKNKHSGLNKIIADVPNGSPHLTTRAGRGIERIDWAEAARWLVHTHAWDPSGIRSGAVGDPRVKDGKGALIGTAWAGWLGGIYPTGKTLDRTLLLNLVATDEVGLVSGEEDAPPWERPSLAAAPDTGEEREPRGVVDVYTWQSRRMNFVGDDSGVTGLVLAQGDALWPHNRTRFEPMTAWRLSEPQTNKRGAPVFMPKAHMPSRALWRGIGSLLPQAPVPATPKGQPRYRPPAIFEWVQILADEDLIPGIVVNARAVGVEYGPNAATYADIIDDEVSLPVALVSTDGRGLALTAVRAVSAAEDAVRALRNLAANVARASGASGDGSLGAVRERASERAYEGLGRLYQEWLRTIDSTEPEHAQQQWRDDARLSVQSVAREILESASPGAVVGRVSNGTLITLASSEIWFMRSLYKALPAEPLPIKNGDVNE